MSLAIDSTPCGGYSFTLSCPRCAGPVEHVASSAASCRDQRAVAYCPACRNQYVVHVELLIAGDTHTTRTPR